MLIFASVMPVRLRSFHRGDTVPDLPGESFFHSAELFRVFEQTRGYDPVLIVAYVDERVAAKLLAVVRRSARRFPPSVIRRCEAYGAGEYFCAESLREDLFGEMLEYLTAEALRKCFLIEFRNLESPLFGHRAFRRNRYFAVNWLRVHNSLHSRAPEERLSPSRRRQIDRALRGGAVAGPADGEADVEGLSRMLRRAYSSQVRKHLPDQSFFRRLAAQAGEKELARAFTVKYRGRIIGGSVCVFSGPDAYLWFSAGMRKTYARLYPGVLAVWAALTYAWRKGCRHLEFMDAGLPFRRHGYREFVLRFGGKQSSTRRWFRFRWGWLNALLRHFYR